jgi:hypothetical protein
MTLRPSLIRSLLALSVSACSSSVAPVGADATVDAATVDAATVDAATVDAATVDATALDVSALDVPIPDIQVVDVGRSDVGRSDVGRSDAGADRATLSTECRAETVAPTETCGSSTSCPVVTHLALRCSQQGFGASVAAGPDAVRVLTHTNQGTFVPRLLTLREGEAPAVEDLRFLPSGLNVLTVDDAGHTSLFAPELPGIARLRPGPDHTWSRETVRASDSLLLILAVRERADTSAAVIYTSPRDNTLRLSTLRASGWTDRVAFTSGFPSSGVGLTPEGDPLVAYWLSNAPSDGMRTLRLEGVGAPRDLLAETSNTDAGNAPRLIEGGLSGAEALPVVAVNTLGVMHALVPDGEAYRDQVVAAATALREETDCPATTGGPPGGPCEEVASCTFQRQGMTQPTDWAIARTADQRVWLAWVAAAQRGTARVVRRCGGPGCVCVREDIATAVGSVAHIAEVTAAGVVERFSGPVSDAVGVGGQNVSMSARGSALHLAMALGGGGGLDLRYLEIETSGLR